jgi:SAM-dependent methyltransferase
VFDERGPWLRDEYKCFRCGSIPRHRALVYVLGLVVPDWPNLAILESSPGGPVSRFIADRCSNYIPSHFHEKVAPGEMVNGVRCEDLRALTLPDEAVDVVVTGDVFEHVLDPGQAFREIARVLRPGGVHVFTVPIYSRPETVVRVADDGTELMAPDYHGNPIGDGRSLVIREWGDDILTFIEAAAGTPTERFNLTSRWRGLLGQMKDVLVSRSRADNLETPPQSS